jgi:hypothetical protein
MSLGHMGRGLVLSAVALAGSATTASAAPMLFTLGGDTWGNWASASVIFSYTGISATTGQVDVQVTNTSTFGDPRVTGFAFNLPGSITGVSGFSSSLNGWQSLFSSNDINTPGQFGFFDAAATAHTPNTGVARNHTATFSFTLSGSNMLARSENSFLGQFSYDPPRGANESGEYFIARFQRVGPFGLFSDVSTPKGDARLAPPTKEPTQVPEPTTLLLSALGLVGLVAMRRRQA